MKRVLKLSHNLGCKTFVLTTKLFIKSWGIPQPLKYFVRLAAEELNNVNTTQMQFDKFLNKYLRKFIR